MDPITFIVAALAAGAAAGLTATAEEAVKDAYAGLKQWLQDRYANVELAVLEKDPKSTTRRDLLAEELQAADAGADDELLAKVQELLDVLAQHAAAAQAASAVGVDLANVQAAALKIKSVRASGTGVSIKASTFAGDIEIGDVSAGLRGSPDPNA